MYISQIITNIKCLGMHCLDIFGTPLVRLQFLYLEIGCYQGFCVYFTNNYKYKMFGQLWYSACKAAIIIFLKCFIKTYHWMRTLFTTIKCYIVDWFRWKVNSFNLFSTLFSYFLKKLRYSMIYSATMYYTYFYNCVFRFCSSLRRLRGEAVCSIL